MALKSLVLHLGAHKTGTSLIQKFIRDNAELCADAGVASILRSETDRIIGWGRSREIDAGKQDLRQYIDSADKSGFSYFVLSHENALGRPFDAQKGATRLYPYGLGRAKTLRAALEGYPIKVIYYFRSAAAFVESYYLQTIHEGDYTPFKTWRRNTGRPSLSWGPVYEDLCEVFGAECVTPKVFNSEIALGQEAFLEAFFSTFMDPAPNPSAFNNFYYAPVRNSSIGEKGLEIALAANPLLSSGSERKLMRKFLQANFSNLTHSRASLLGDSKIAQIADTFRDDIPDIMARHGCAGSEEKVATADAVACDGQG